MDNDYVYTGNFPNYFFNISESASGDYGNYGEDTMMGNNSLNTSINGVRTTQASVGNSSPSNPASNAGYDAEMKAQAAVTLIICILGLIGNLVVIFVITVLREFQKSVTHWYVLQLAIADSIFLLTLPFRAIENLNGTWIYSEGLCRTVETIRFLNYYSSILFLTVMSIDRYIAVCHSFSNRLGIFRKKKSAVIITISIWVISLLICIPLILYSAKAGTSPYCTCRIQFPHESKNTPAVTQGQDGSGIGGFSQEEICRFESDNDEMKYQECLGVELTPDEGYCKKGLEETVSEESDNNYYPDNYENYGDYGPDAYGSSESRNQNPTDVCRYDDQPVAFYTFIWYNFAVMFVFPFCVMSVCYGLIIYRLQSTRIQSGGRKMSDQTTPSHQTHKKKQVSKSDRDRLRITRMCAILVTTFFLCWILFHAAHIAKIYGIYGTREFCQYLSLVSRYLAYVNSVLNPYLYSFLGASFIRRFRTALRSSVKSQSHSSSNFFNLRLGNMRRKSNSNQQTNVTRVSRNITDGKTSSSEHQASRESNSHHDTQIYVSPVTGSTSQNITEV